jgi:uncharacterized membrane protein
MDFNTSKTLGGVGALLLFIGVLPFVNSYGIVPLIGVILLLMGFRGMAEYYREARIFNNVLYGTVIGIVGVVIFVSVMFMAMLGFLAEILPGWNRDWASLSQLNPADISSNLDFSAIGPFVATILLALVVLFVCVLAVSLCFRKSLGIL